MKSLDRVMLAFIIGIISGGFYMGLTDAHYIERIGWVVAGFFLVSSLAEKNDNHKKGGK